MTAVEEYALTLADLMETLAVDFGADDEALTEYLTEFDVSRLPPQLHSYWLGPKGSARVGGWGAPGSWTKCTVEMRKEGVPGRMIKGLCANLYHEATGHTPNQKHLGEDDMEEFEAYDFALSELEEAGLLGRLKRKFDPQKHPHGEHGRWTPTGGGKTPPAATPGKAPLGGLAKDLVRAKYLKRRSEVGQLSPSEQAELDALRKKHGYDAELEEFAAAEPYGDVRYADPGYQSDNRKRYPIDTPEHVRAAWSYINMPKNSGKYSSEQLKAIKTKVKKAMTGIGADVQTAVVVVAAARSKNKIQTPPADAPETGEPDAAGGCPPGMHKVADGSCADDQDAAPQTYADEPWEGVLTVEGAESGDGRMFSLGSLDWAALPMPLMYQPANSGGHKDSIMVGEITNAARKANVITGWGHVSGEALAGEHGDGIRQMMKAGGVSVDVDKVKDADVELVYADEETAGAGLLAKPETTIFHRGRIRGATLVAYPAFVEAKLHFTNEVLAAASDDCGCGDETFADESWEFDADEPLTAATHTITLADLPPREWFDRPTDVKMYGALTVTDEGRVFGRLAPANVTHRAVKRKVPMRTVDYSRWMNKETIVAGGDRVVTGVITMNCGHAATENYGTLANRKEHYDNSCSIAANVRIGEDADGVWVAGALRHGVTGDQVATMMGCQLSGDWQPHPDRPGITEFIAALLVPVPGFPEARTAPSVTYNDGVLSASAIPIRLAAAEEPDATWRAFEAIQTAKRMLVTSLGIETDPKIRKEQIMAALVREN